MSPRPRVSSVAAAAALLLAGCEGAVIDGAYYDPAYFPSEAGVAPLFVRPARLAESVPAGFAGKGAYPMDFPLPREAERPAYRVAVVFQPPTSLAPAALCSSAALPEGGFPSSGKAEFVAALCRGDRAMTSTSGRLPVEEPGFTRGLASVARALFPLKAFKT